MKTLLTAVLTTVLLASTAFAKTNLSEEKKYCRFRFFSASGFVFTPWKSSEAAAQELALKIILGEVQLIGSRLHLCASVSKR